MTDGRLGYENIPIAVLCQARRKKLRPCDCFREASVLVRLELDQPSFRINASDQEIRNVVRQSTAVAVVNFAGLLAVRGDRRADLCEDLSFALDV